ncbi:class F sortase [Nocardioides sp. REDSEA-S30_B4]|uniref:class F sortase n=1 Tax=Nocardioides sp. REDSEA-S30_B4 TaxID=1811552 RepID=UPI000AE2117A|nr:class F sortase [Nocardioides sp. REDSEA-S30_B4]
MRAATDNRGRSWLSGTLALVAASLVVLGLLWWWQQPGSSSDPSASVSSTPSSSSGSTGTPMRASTPPPAKRLPSRPGDPTRLSIPALDVDTEVDAVGTRRDVLVPPADPQRVGWWGGGAAPGEPGRALLAGHTVHTGGGALDDLEMLEPGDRVVVGGEGSRTRWVVDSVRVLAKGELAREAERVFAQDGPPRLVLLTCEDWDGAAYRSNVVVVARPA